MKNQKNSKKKMSEGKLAVIAQLVKDGYNYEEADLLVNARKKKDVLKSDITETDEFERAVELKFTARAGFTSYLDELKARLADLKDVREKRFYVFPIKLSKKMAISLINQTIIEAETNQGGNPDWTERDQVEMILKIYDGMTLALTKSAEKS